jgi:hypothetical protein
LTFEIATTRLAAPAQGGTPGAVDYWVVLLASKYWDAQDTLLGAIKESTDEFSAKGL